jgi:hypothetical protein
LLARNRGVGKLRAPRKRRKMTIVAAQVADNGRGGDHGQQQTLFLNQSVGVGASPSQAESGDYSRVPAFAGLRRDSSTDRDAGRRPNVAPVHNLATGPHLSQRRPRCYVKASRSLLGASVSAWYQCPSPIGIHAVPHCLIDPDHREWLEQARGGERPRIKDFEAQLFDQSLHNLLSLGVAPELNLSIARESDRLPRSVRLHCSVLRVFRTSRRFCEQCDIRRHRPSANHGHARR